MENKNFSNRGDIRIIIYGPYDSEQKLFAIGDTLLKKYKEVRMSKVYETREKDGLMAIIHIDNRYVSPDKWSPNNSA